MWCHPYFMYMLLTSLFENNWPKKIKLKNRHCYCEASCNLSNRSLISQWDCSLTVLCQNEYIYTHAIRQLETQGLFMLMVAVWDLKTTYDLTLCIIQVFVFAEPTQILLKCYSFHLVQLALCLIILKVMHNIPPSPFAKVKIPCCSSLWLRYFTFMYTVYTVCRCWIRGAQID